MAKKRRKYTEQELANDASLKWWCYRHGELLYSDLHQDVVRFGRYEENLIVVLSANGLAELPDRVQPLQVRRPTADHEPLPDAFKRYVAWGKAEQRKKQK